jgi:hypothetical protein
VIDWETLNPAVKTLIERLAVDSRLPAALDLEHADRSRKAMSVARKQTLTVQVLNVVSLGDDEERREDVAADATGDDAPWAGKLRTRIVGHRKVTYRLVCDALENSDREWAWATIERIRTRLRRSTSIDALARVDASLNHVGAAIEANFTAQSRAHNRVILDFALNVRVNDVDETPTNWIEHVVLTSEIENVDGDELPVPPNVTDLEIPPLA